MVGSKGAIYFWRVSPLWALFDDSPVTRVFGPDFNKLRVERLTEAGRLELGDEPGWENFGLIQ